MIEIVEYREEQRNIVDTPDGWVSIVRSRIMTPTKDEAWSPYHAEWWSDDAGWVHNGYPLGFAEFGTVDEAMDALRGVQWINVREA